MVNNGTGLRSGVWDSQGESTDDPLTVDGAFSSGTLMVKCYLDGDGTEVLVIEEGKSLRSIGTTSPGNQGSQATTRHRTSRPIERRRK